MELTEKLRFRKGDCLAIGVVIALALAVLLCFFPGNDEPASQAQIYLNGVCIQTVDLTRDQTFEVCDRYRNVIAVSHGSIAVAQSDCPGEDCVHSGSISAPGRVLVCLPNGLEIRVIADEADVDFVVR